MKNKWRTFLGLFFIAVLFSACSSSQKAKPMAKHVVMVGFDALGSYAYDKAEMPVLKQFAADGAYTLNSRAVLPSSSAINWASALMSAGPTTHGYTEWGSRTPEIPSIVLSQYGKFPSIFTQLKEQRPEAKTALIYSWGGIGYLIEEQTVNFNIHTEGDEEATVDKTIEVIKNEKPAFTFIHFDEPDGAGHNAGHNSPGYYEELKRVDTRLERILQGIKEAGIENETIVLVVSDHGGIDYGHGGKNIDEVAIPFFIKGPGIKVGHKIESPMIIYDYGTILARLLGVEPHDAWRGQVPEEIFN